MQLMFDAIVSVVLWAGTSIYIAGNTYSVDHIEQSTTADSRC
jgi:hypothetical protein